MPTRRNLDPLLRWAGGKRWLRETIARVADVWKPGGYMEPFAGGASVFLHADWPTPTLGDANTELIRCYRGLAKDVAAVRKSLTLLPCDRKTYEKIAASKACTDVEAAVRLLYLNRLAYGGVYRTNRAGAFNVPFSGDRNTEMLLRGDRLEQVGAALAQCVLVEDDFEATLSHARPGTLVYCDPVYSLPGPEKAFRRYTDRPFAWPDQERLADAAAKLAQNGCLILISNSTHPMVRDLYRDAGFVPLSRRNSFPKAASRESKEALYVLCADADVEDCLVSTASSHSEGGG